MTMEIEECLSNAVQAYVTRPNLTVTEAAVLVSAWTLVTICARFGGMLQSYLVIAFALLYTYLLFSNQLGF
jgi:hypothetical protein